MCDVILVKSISQQLTYCREKCGHVFVLIVCILISILNVNVAIYYVHPLQESTLT